MEQKKIWGLEWELQMEQTALLASPIYVGQAQGGRRQMYKRRKPRQIESSPLGSAHPHTARMFPSTVLGSLCVQLPPHELLLSWATVVLGLSLTGAELRLFQPGWIWVTAPEMSGECVISSVLSCCNKSLKQWTDQCYSSVLFGKEKKYILEVWGRAGPKEVKRREARGSILAPLFYVFSPPSEPALCKLS